MRRRRVLVITIPVWLAITLALVLTAQLCTAVWLLIT